MTNKTRSFPFIDDPLIEKVHLEDGTHGIEKNNYGEISKQDESGLLYFDFKLEDQSIKFGFKRYFSFFLQPSDGKTCKRIFGGKYGLEKEKHRLQDHGKWIIHPCSHFRYIWLLLMILLLVVNLAIIPVYVAYFSFELSLNVIAFNIAFDLIFILDIIVNFGTGIITTDNAAGIILQPSHIVKRYLTTWFIVDLVSSIPIDYLYVLTSDNMSGSFILQAGMALRKMRRVKLLSLLRLLRVCRLIRYTPLLEYLLDLVNKVTPIVNLVFLAVGFTHWFACLHFFGAMMWDNPNSWVMQNKLADATLTNQYLWSFFKVVLNVSPQSNDPTITMPMNEAWIWTGTLIIKSILCLLFMAHLVHLISSSNTSTGIHGERLIQVERYVAQKKLPQILKDRIMDYCQYSSNDALLDEKFILQQFSESLRREIMNLSAAELLKSSYLFSGSDNNFLLDIIVHLQFELVQPGDMIVRKGTIGNKMYFIRDGIAEVISNDGHVIARLEEGTNFGELCLLTKTRRLFSVCGNTYCRLYSIDRDRFLSVLEDYPKEYKRIEGLATQSWINTFSNLLWLDSKRLTRDVVNDNEDEDAIDKSVTSHYQGSTRIGLKLQRIMSGLKIKNYQKVRSNQMLLGELKKV